MIHSSHKNSIQFDYPPIIVKFREMSDTLEKNFIIPNVTPFRIVSQEILHRYQEQVNLHYTDCRAVTALTAQLKDF